MAYIQIIMYLKSSSISFREKYYAQSLNTRIMTEDLTTTFVIEYRHL